MFNKKEYAKKYYQEHKYILKERSKKWRQDNKEHCRKYFQEWCKNNPRKDTRTGIFKRDRREYEKNYRDTHKKERYIACKNWRQNNLEKIREKFRRNPKARIDKNVANLIWYSLRGKKAGLKWERLVDYTVDDLMKYLEKQFDDKMTWDNYGSYWWIDHIKPKSLFKYESAEDPEFKKCWALSNLQPLEKIANIKKKNHYEPPQA